MNVLGLPPGKFDMFEWAGGCVIVKGLVFYVANTANTRYRHCEENRSRVSQTCSCSLSDVVDTIS